jgi:hypothetical protein
MSDNKLDDKIEDLIERWHSQSTEMSLYEYLGMTWGEYVTWVETNSVPPEYTPPSY